VQECLKFPAQKCPDILALALIESDGPLNMIRHEIISSLIPIFLGNHSNASTILHHAWNHQVSLYHIKSRIQYCSVSQSVFRGTLGFRRMHIIIEKLILYYTRKKYYFIIFKKNCVFN
jgi:CCR4-NOT transcription complex subunit 1